MLSRFKSFIHRIFNIYNSKGFIKAIETIERYWILCHLIISLALCYVIEALARHSLGGGFEFVRHHTLAYLYNSYLIFILLLISYLFRKRFATRFIVLAVIFSLGYINSNVLANRVTPFGFTDFYMISDLLTMKRTSYFGAAQIVILVVAFCVPIILALFLAFKGHMVTPKLKLPVRAAIVALGLISLPLVTGFLQQKQILASYFGNLAQGYSDYGFLYGFNMSVFSRGVEKPLFYNEENIEKLVAESDMGDTTLTGNSGPNVVVMLMESFFDTDAVEFLQTNADPSPYFHQLQKEFSSGYLTVPVVGAGTCNTEFEVLTGMSCQFFGPGEYPQKTILKEVSDCESIADVLKDIGYKSHVVHNNGGNFYSRKNAFSKMGFDTFTSSELLDINRWTPKGTWPTDDVLIDATRDSMDSTPERDLVYTITVSTHGDYPTEKLISAPLIKPVCTGKSEEDTNRWEYYLNMIRRQDDFLRRYIAMLEDRDEPTLLIMFGDHLPTMGLTSDELATNNLFLTNYATWNNFDMAKKDADLTSYQLVSEYLNRLGIHGGTLVNYNQSMTSQSVNPRSLWYLNGIQMLQYDILYGKRYAYHGEDPYPATDIQMGIHPIVIDKIYEYNGKLHIFGRNFTRWSRLCTEDDILPTSYKNSNYLTVSTENLEKNTPIRVGQVGGGNEIFRASTWRIYN